MTYQNLPNGLRIPSFYPTALAGGFADANNITIDADDEGFGVVMSSPVTGTITDIEFLHGNSLNTPGDVVVRVETLDANNLPSGTLFAAGAEATISIGTPSVIYLGTLATPCNVTLGDRYAIVCKRPAGSSYIGTVNRMTTSLPITGFPTPLTKTSASWSIAGSFPKIRPVFNSGIFPFPYLFTYQTLSRNISSTSNPDVVGNIMNFPYNVKAVGMFCTLDFDGDIDLKLLDSDGSTVLESASNPANLPNSTGITTNVHIFPERILTANTDYRVVLEPTTTTSSAIVRLQFANSTERSYFPGAEFCYVTNAKDPVNAASFNNIDTELYPVGLILSAIDIPTGGSVAFPISGARN